MAAYAEGLNILKNANVGKATPREGRGDDAAAQPRALPVRLRPRRRHRAVAARQRRSRPGCSTSPRRPSSSDPQPRRVRGQGLRLRRGPLDGRRRQRRGRARPRADRRALRALRLPRPGPLPEQGALRHALGFRRPRGEEVKRRTTAAAPTRSSSSAPPATSPTRRSSPPCRRWRGGAGSTSPSSGVAQVGLDARAARRARAGQRHRARRRSTPRRSPKLGRAAALRRRRLRRRRHLRAAPRRARRRRSGPLHYLAIPPSMFPTVVEEPGRGRLHARARGSSWRSRSAATSPRRAALNADPARGLPRGERSSASTTTSARRRSRTSSTSASPTPSSSRSGTGSYVENVQITMAESFGVKGRGKFYEETGRHPRRDPEPPAAGRELPGDGGAVLAPTPRRSATSRPRCCARCGRCSSDNLVRGQFRGYRDEPGVAPGLARGHLRGAAPATSTPGAGRACRSTCAPASRSTMTCTEVIVELQAPAAGGVHRAAPRTGQLRALPPEPAGGRSRSARAPSGRARA